MQRNCGRYLGQMTRQYLTRKGIDVTATGHHQPHRTFFRRHCSPFVEMENRMKEMDRYFDRMDRHFDSHRISPFANRFFNFPVVESEVKPGESGHPGKYTLTVNLGRNFSPEDIKISLKDRILTIDAKLEIKSQDETSRLYQEVSRQFTLPEGINPEEVKSLVSSDGVLSIEVPLPEVEAPKPKEIPISVESSAKQ